MIQLMVVVLNEWDEAFFKAHDNLLRSHQIHILDYGKNSKDALSLHQQHQSDLLMMPLFMPGKCAVTVSRRIKRHDPNANILIVMEKPLRFFSKIIADEHLGSLISRSASVTRLISAIEQTCEGKRYLFNEHDHYLANEIEPYQIPTIFNGLSDTELDVMIQLLQFKAIRRIADEMNVTPSTVYDHRLHLLNKLALEKERDLYDLARKYQIMSR